MTVRDQREIVLAQPVTNHPVLLSGGKEGPHYEGPEDEPHGDHGVERLSEGRGPVRAQHPHYEGVAGSVQTAQEDPRQHYGWDREG